MRGEAIHRGKRDTSIVKLNTIEGRTLQENILKRHNSKGNKEVEVRQTNPPLHLYPCALRPHMKFLQ